MLFLQCFDSVRWETRNASDLYKQPAAAIPQILPWARLSWINSRNVGWLSKN